MTDIVERLRNRKEESRYDDLMDAAADEIERLRVNISALVRDKEIDRDEIERLGKLQAARDLDFQKATQARDDEIERLRVNNSALVRDKEIDRAEIERLRAIIKMRELAAGWTEQGNERRTTGEPAISGEPEAS